LAKSAVSCRCDSFSAQRAIGKAASAGRKLANARPGRFPLLRSMRILLTADPMIAVPPSGYGGIERIIDALVRRFRGSGHEIGLVAHPASTSPAHCRYPWAGLRVASALDGARNALALNRAIRAFRPDVVHSFSRLAYLALQLPRRRPLIMSYQRHTGGRQVAWAARLGGGALRFTGCSEFICAMGRAAGGRWTAIPNFVEPERYRFEAEVAADAPLVFLSRIESIKGPDLAIAIARAAGRRLIPAGNRPERGPERAFWDREIAPCLGRDGIEWVGEVDDAAKDRLLGRAAALVVPIRWDEPFGIVFAEAFATGTPVITCARGAAPEIVDPGRTGYFIASVEEGAAAVARLAEIDRAACRRAVLERFSLEVCAERYLGLYRESVAPPLASRP
jgi:glycosyltransferase involved in cell wall biosynthesis